MASNPFIGHIMGTKLLKLLTALVKAFIFGFENKNNVLNPIRPGLFWSPKVLMRLT